MHPTVYRISSSNRKNRGDLAGISESLNGRVLRRNFSNEESYKDEESQMKNRKWNFFKWNFSNKTSLMKLLKLKPLK